MPINSLSSKSYEKRLGLFKSKCGTGAEQRRDHPHIQYEHFIYICRISHYYNYFTLDKESFSYRIKLENVYMIRTWNMLFI